MKGGFAKHGRKESVIQPTTIPMGNWPKNVKRPTQQILTF